MYLICLVFAFVLLNILLKLVCCNLFIVNLFVSVFAHSEFLMLTNAIKNTVKQQ